jgi:arylsulfatase A-like enzyme
MFNLVDFMATFAHLVGQNVPAAVAPDSLDLSAVLLGQTTNNLREDTVLHGISDTLALRWGDWKYVPANAKAKASGMGSGANPSDTRFGEARITRPLLFNLATDPDEQTNVISQFPKKAAAMRTRLAAIKNRTAK